MRCNLTDLVNGHIIWVKLDILKFGLKTNGLYLLGYRDELQLVGAWRTEPTYHKHYYRGNECVNS